MLNLCQVIHSQIVRIGGRACRNWLDIVNSIAVAVRLNAAPIVGLPRWRGSWVARDGSARDGQGRREDRLAYIRVGPKDLMEPQMRVKVRHCSHPDPGLFDVVRMRRSALSSAGRVLVREGTLL